MASRYWVGGTGTWNATETTHWSATSGGVGGATVPTSADDVIFDSLSNTTAYTVTLSGTLNCNNFTMGAPLAGKVTWSGNPNFNIYGNLNLSGGTTGITNSFKGNIYFKGSSGTKTIQSNSVIFSKTNIYISGAATFQLLDNWTIDKITKTAGTFDPNGQTVYLINNSTGGDIPLFGALTFYNLTITFTAGSSDSGFYLNSNITVTNNLTITGYSADKRPMIRSNVKGTQRTITCTGASVNYSNITFEDINILNGTLGTNSIVGDGGGNSGITFTSSTDQHFTNVNGAPNSSDWENAANWTSRVPLPQDNLFFDCAFGTAKTIKAIPRYIGHNLDFTGATWTTSLTFISGNSSWIAGSLTLIAGLTVTLNYGLYFYGRGSHTIDTKGIELNSAFNGGVKIDAITGSYTLLGDYNTRAAEIFNIISGTFDTSTFSLSVGNLQSSSGSNLYLGSGVHSIIGTGTTTCSIVGNLFAQSSTLKFTNTSNTAITFVGNGKTYNNIWWSRGGSTAINTISGSNTFNDFKDDGTAAHSILFTAATTQTFTTFTVSGSAGNLITINSTTTATHALVKSGGGIISSDYLNIQHSVATPATTWYAGANSTNNQATATAGSGWIFTAPLTTLPIELNIGDTWKVIDSIQINIGDVWKTVTKVQINIGDVWKDVF